MAKAQNPKWLIGTMKESRVEEDWEIDLLIRPLMYSDVSKVWR
jgi:hypothetical protein